MRSTVILATLVVLTCVASPALAQSDMEAPALDAMDRKVALMFDLDGILSAPTSFEQIGVGLRYSLSDVMYLRAAMGLDNRTTEVDPDGGDNSTDESSAFAMEAGLDFVLRRNENLVLYVGGLLQLGLTTDDPDGDDNKVEGSTFTIAGVAGANWFFTRNVSLGAEYRFGIERTTSELDANNSVKTTELRVGTGTAAFLLGFWF